MGKRKIEESKIKLDKFLEENELFVGAILRYTQTGIIPEVVVLPKQFLANKDSKIQEKL